MDAPISPGGIISIFGSQLAADARQFSGVPVSPSLGSTTVVLAGQFLPLLYAGPNQINALIPYNVPVDTKLQLLVRNGPSYGTPQEVTVAAAQPAIFTLNQAGSGQGHIYVVGGSRAESGTPAQGGDIVTIYAMGLGHVTQSVGLGEVAPLSPLAETAGAVTATIGGKDARILILRSHPGIRRFVSTECRGSKRNLTQ